jgi:flagellin
MLTLNSNITSLIAQNNLSSTQASLQTSLQRLSSGMRINSAKDDPAGLYTSQLMTATINGDNAAISNASDGTSMAQTAEGALGQIANNLQTIRNLAVQSANGTVQDRSGLQAETDQLTQEISRIVETAKYNGVSLFTSASAITFQIGADGTASNQVSVSGVALNTNGASGLYSYSGTLTATNTVNVSSQATASAAIANIDADIAKVSSQRATYGAVQQRFDAVTATLTNVVQNLSAARSQITDTNFAAETANLTRMQVLQQAGTAMLSQANAIPQSVLALLR